MRFRVIVVLMSMVVGFVPVMADDCDCPKVEQTVVKVCVDNTRTLAQLITEGKYDWVDERIFQKFTIESGDGAVPTDIILLHFDKEMTTNQVLSEMDRLGLRPITLLELLSLGAQRPELQREFPIIALGQVRRVGGGGNVACLSSSVDSLRSLSLYWVGSGWSEYYRFGAVRK